MGVTGLQTFLKINKEHLGYKKNLSDTHLVIDAASLQCQLYTSYVLKKDGPDYRDDIYGGDLVKYGQNVREFFDNLKKCKITAVLVCDGSTIGKNELKDYYGSKTEESKRRGLERFKRAEEFNENSYNQDVFFPQNIGHVFRSIVSELGIQRIQAPYEADPHIARVANELHCPVLSSDSDFLIYALEKGFILVDHLDFKQPKAQDNEWSIEATIFSQAKLARSIKDFNLEVMPLLSLILGNDYVDGKLFFGVMKNICNLSYYGPFETKSFNHKRIANLIHWLQGKSLDASIKSILQLIKPEYRERINKLFTILLRSYDIKSDNDFEREIATIYSPERVTSPEHMTPIEFLQEALEKKDLISIVMDIIFKNTHYNYGVLDDFSLTSSLEIGSKPLSLALVLLRPKSYKNLTKVKRQAQVELDSFTLYDRKDGEYTECKLEPLEKLKGFGSLEHLDCYSMILLDANTKRQLLMACFRFTTEKQQSITDSVSQLLSGPFIEQASLCFLLIRYIRLESKLVPNAHFVNSLVLTLVFYAMKSDQLNKQAFTSSEACDRLVSLLQPLSVKNNGENAQRPNQPLYRRIMHFISQLQVAYKAYCLVNSLLDHAHHPPKLELFFNAVLVFRITRMLHLGEEKMESICCDLPHISTVCDSLQARVLN